ncbi:TPA: hypothetical protein N0F65_011571 [Lagenidium giganteum]|uniref:CAF1B/HIR1 beta-propeller domain-containing protein n=1 Tax=Lagenidium giganteum TaxID=4803 RepID=A0AAV2YKY7_9STRA|nr:TPA: hypothetical protein N0F65_011571 [Lagenidium giganteum]
MDGMSTEAPDKAAADAAAVTGVTASMIRVMTPEIRWHYGPTGLNEAILSIDFHQRNRPTIDAVDDGQKPYRILATGGADKEIKLWRIQDDLKDTTGIEFVFSLTGHDRSVNCVRFSPDGTYLASASDDSTVILWSKPKTADDDWRWDKITSFSDVSRTLLACGHKGDITDLAWSHDGAFLSSTSVDNSVVIWNVATAQMEERRRDHTQYVQGVAWDPLNEYLVTQGNDRTCRVYSLTGFDPITRQTTTKKNRKFSCVHTIKMRDLSNANESKKEENAPGDEAPAPVPKHRMYVDDTCPAFARRLTWTPDGNYLLTPTALFRETESSPAVNTVYAFSRGNLAQPTLHLPGQDKASIGIRCSPLLYQPRHGKESSAVSNLYQSKYRSLFSVITLNAVLLYDTEQTHPICVLKDLHYADLTDLAWSSDGQMLVISSQDGYLSFVLFDDEFLGDVVPAAEVEAFVKARTSVMFTPAVKVKRKKLKQPQPEESPNNKKNLVQEEAAVVVAAETTPAQSAPVPAPAAPTTSSEPKSIEPAASSAGGVNVLQVRKKRKIAPTLVSSTPSEVAVEAAKPTWELEGLDCLEEQKVSICKAEGAKHDDVDPVQRRMRLWRRELGSNERHRLKTEADAVRLAERPTHEGVTHEAGAPYQPPLREG